MRQRKTATSSYLWRVLYGLIPVLGLALVLQASEASLRSTSYFVVTALESSKTEAQALAAVEGGWVLNTNLYRGLPSDLFAVVRGPFQREQSAASRAAELSSHSTWADAYVQAVGAPSEVLLAVAEAFGRDLPLQAVAALVGEVDLDLVRNPGGSTACEFEEPHFELQLTVARSVLQLDPENDARFLRVAERKSLDSLGLYLVEKTGVVDALRQCRE